MPNGELRFARSTLRNSATPSPSASRSNVMRLADGTAAPAFAMHLLHDLALDALAVVRAFGRIGLGDEHVAVGQHVDPARMRETAGECIHRDFGRRRRLRARGPALRLGDLHGGNQLLFGRRQVGVGPTLVAGDATGPVSVGPTEVQAQSTANASTCIGNAILLTIRQALGEAPRSVIGANVPACRKEPFRLGFTQCCEPSLYMARCSQPERSDSSGWSTSSWCAPIHPDLLVLVALAFLGLGLWAGARCSAARRRRRSSRTPGCAKSLGVSDRELEVLSCSPPGGRTRRSRIASNVSPNTVKTHVAKLFGKLAARRRTQAISRARELGMIR